MCEIKPEVEITKDAFSWLSQFVKELNGFSIHDEFMIPKKPHFKMQKKSRGKIENSCKFLFIF